MRHNVLNFFVASILAAGATVASAQTVQLAGKPEVVMELSASSGCSSARGADVPDSRAYAFRRNDGQVMLFSSNSNNYVSTGPSLDEVSRGSCDKTFQTPPLSENAGDYYGRMWLKAAMKAPDGEILGFIHNEYHGEVFDPADCGSPRSGAQACWYGASLLAVSKDGGKTFQLPAKGSPLLAGLPFPYAKKQGRIGYVAPYPLSNRKGDSKPFMYVFFNATSNLKVSPPVTTTGGNGVCVMRGLDSNPESWRMWGGRDFDVDVANPYQEKITDPQKHLCKPVLPFIFGAVKYVPSLGNYLAVGSTRREVVYSFSGDLVNWSKPQALMQITAKQRWREGKALPTAYFSLLDPTSKTQSFETLEKRPYLYYVEFTNPKGKGKAKRASRMMRVPLVIQ